MNSAVSRLIFILTNSVKRFLFFCYPSQHLLLIIFFNSHSNRMKWDLYLALIAEDVERFSIFLLVIYTSFFENCLFSLFICWPYIFLFTFPSRFGIPDNLAVSLLIFFSKRKIITSLQRYLNPAMLFTGSFTTAKLLMQTRPLSAENKEYEPYVFSRVFLSHKGGWNYAEK